MNIITLFFAGLFFANGIPHFIHGISGRKFPTPFAKPPGKGLSSSMINVAWGLTNFLAAILLLELAGDFKLGLNPNCISFFIGFMITSIGLSIAFQRAERDI